MDLGATICTPKRPACALCPWMAPCRARAAGLQESLPRRSRRRGAAQLRRGAAFVVLRARRGVLLRTRPPTGLLGGMAEPPTSAWEPDYEPARAMLDAPLEARWKRLPGIVRHVFTHFPLELTVFFASVAATRRRPPICAGPRGRSLREEALAGVDEKGAGARLRRSARTRESAESRRQCAGQGRVSPAIWQGRLRRPVAVRADCAPDGGRARPARTRLS